MSEFKKFYARDNEKHYGAKNLGKNKLSLFPADEYKKSAIENVDYELIEIAALEAEQEKVRKLTVALEQYAHSNEGGPKMTFHKADLARQALNEIEGDISTTKGSNG